MQQNNFLFFMNLQNTESAQLCGFQGLTLQGIVEAKIKTNKDLALLRPGLFT